MTSDIKKNYLGTPLKNYKYAKFLCKNIPQDFIDANDLEPLFNEHGFIYMQIQKGMYGLKQAGKIANDQLKKVLSTPWIPSHSHTGPVETRQKTNFFHVDRG